MSMKTLVYEAGHSLIKQSFGSMERNKTYHGVPSSVNADGFGVAWYSKEDKDNPCVFVSTLPAWNDRNLLMLSRVVSADNFFMHVRAASPGSTISRTNCHPFTHKKFTFMHNGCVSSFKLMKRRILLQLNEETFAAIRGETDSEYCFALFLNHLENINAKEHTVEEMREAMQKTIKVIMTLSKQLKIDGVHLLNFAVTDGKSIVVSRYVSHKDAKPASLYYACGTDYVRDPTTGKFEMIYKDRVDRNIIIASEAISEEKSNWIEVPRNFFLCVDAKVNVSMCPVQDNEKEIHPKHFDESNSLPSNHLHRVENIHKDIIKEDSSSA